MTFYLFDRVRALVVLGSACSLVPAADIELECVPVLNGGDMSIGQWASRTGTPWWEDNAVFAQTRGRIIGWRASRFSYQCVAGYT